MTVAYSVARYPVNTAADLHVAFRSTNHGEHAMKAVRLAIISLMAAITALAWATPLSAGTRAYVPRENANSVSVIDMATRTQITSIPVGLNPVGIAINAKKARAYVANGNGGSVSVIDTNTDMVVATVPVTGQYPVHLAVSPSGEEVYVTVNSPVIAQGYVSVINTNTNTEVASIRVGLAPYRIVVSPNGTRAYTADFGGSLSTIDTINRRLVSITPFPSGLTGIALNAAGTRAYVTSQINGRLSVFDVDTNQIVAEIPVGQFPRGVAINRQGTRVYVTNLNSSTISIVDVANNAVVSTLTTQSGPVWIAMSDTTPEAYVVNFNSGTISILDLATNQFTGSINVGITAGDIGLVYDTLMTPLEAIAAAEALSAAIYADRSVPLVRRYLLAFQLRFAILNLHFYRSRTTPEVRSLVCASLNDFVSTIEIYAARRWIPQRSAIDWIYQAEQIRRGIICT